MPYVRTAGATTPERALDWVSDTMLDLRGQRALVTGAGRRVGSEIALALGARGCNVAVHYQSAASGAAEVCEHIQRSGGEAVPLQADLTDRAAARSLVDRAIAIWDGLDVLVLSAANYERVPFESIDDAAWDRALALNLSAPLMMVQRAAPALRTSRGNVVLVTCTSRLAPYRDYLAYQTSKAALHHVMRLLALELAPDVRVNAVAPGSVMPPPDWSSDQLAALVDRIPLGRIGRARDVADAVLYLASASWVTGTEIVVDGGRALV
jgi:pteridine reductase